MAKFGKLFLFICVVVFVGLVVVLWLILHVKPADITADFGGHTSTVSIPPNFFGSGGVGSTVSAQSGIDNLTAVNLRGNRIWINVNTIFPSGDINAPSWSAWDNQLARGTQKGLDPLITVWGTPAPSLGVQACSMPTDVNKWAHLAAAAIKHTDGIKPGLWYELWNEPDTGGLCNSSNYLNDYLKLYGALGPLFKAASPTGKLGGPALASSGNTATWIPALLSGATAPYVEFTSLHIYITGQWLLPNMTWQQAYDTTQAEPNGLAYYYRLFEQTTHKGSQPNAAMTPIEISEYNTNYVYSANNVQNVADYGPLWNLVAVYDFLTVSDKGSVPPSRIHYFMSGDSKGYFCLEGVQGGDLRMCQPPTQGQPYNAVYVPYPPLLAYQLLCASDYLNLEVNGFSMVPSPAAPGGLLAMAFYTATSDDLVLINPTATAVTGLRVKMKHLGFKPTHGQQFGLSNGALAKSDVSASGDVKLDVPAYSSVAVALSQ
jgi:Glycosyl hydrolases family 39